MAYYAIMIIRLCMIIGAGFLLAIGYARQTHHAYPSAHQAGASTQFDCGPASLYLICRSHGVITSLAELKQQSFLSKTGTNLMSLKVAAAHAGFQVEGIKASVTELHRRLRETAGSAILHLPGRQHFVVVLDCTPHAFCIADPNTGCAYWDFDQLVQEGWKGHALLLTR